MQSYLLPGSPLSNENKRVSFRWRTKTIKVSYNIGNKEALCPLCKLSKDTQEHLLTCPVVSSHLSGDTVKDIATALRMRETFMEGSPWGENLKKSTRVDGPQWQKPSPLTRASLLSVEETTSMTKNIAIRRRRSWAHIDEDANVSMCKEKWTVNKWTVSQRPRCTIRAAEVYEVCTYCMQYISLQYTILKLIIQGMQWMWCVQFW